MSVTGHRSVDAGRMYKRVSHNQEEQLSKIIQGNKRPSNEYPEEGSKQNKRVKVEENKENVKPETSSTPVFNFAGCSVTFNY